MSEDEGKVRLNERQLYRKFAGLCIDCGRPLGWRNSLRCPDCNGAARRAYEEEQRRRDSERIEAWRASCTNNYFRSTPGCPAICRRCPFATFNGNTSWYCPLPVCRHEFTLPGEPENPLNTTIVQIVSKRKPCGS